MLEKARGERFLGSALEAKVLLHVADAQLAQSLQALQGVKARQSHHGRMSWQHMYAVSSNQKKLQQWGRARHMKLGHR